MASDSQTAEQVTELVQNLNVDSHTNVGDTLEVASGDASDGGAEASALSGVSDMAAGPYEGYFDTGIYYPPNYYAMPHGFYYGGYEYPLGDWDDYSQHARTDGLDAEALGNDCYGVYNENGTLLYQAGGFEYAQHMYGSYTPNAPISGNGQLYGPAYPYHGHIYQQPVASSRQFLSSASPVDVPSITADSNNPVVDSTKGSLMNENNAALGPRPTYPVTAVPSTGPYVQTTLATSFPVPVSQDGHTGFHWSEGSKSMEGQQRHAISQPLTVTRPLGQTLQAGSRMPTHMSAGRPRFPCNVAPLPGSFSRFYQSPARAFSGFASGRGQGLRFNGFGPRGNGYSWITEKGKARGRGAGSMSNGTGDLDVLNEQNRGPRTSRIRNQQILPGTFRLIKGQASMFSGGHDALGTSFSKDQCNRSDFSTNYESAKFFVIKSYSEDDIHKSIKYNVWASTPNGNKKLDAAYQEAQEKTGHCPVFLFFSVNASGQFCGVAEMVGSVDFSKSMDFWQQDKWNGRFPVKWHIIKDVPNNQLRHIILANNDNKPVTNSRDTQEVNFEQGIEMLKLFKNYLLKTSILDDFQFYENRQRAMQEKKARRLLHTQPQLMIPHGSGNESDSNKGTSSILENEHLENEQQQDNSCKLKDSQLASKSAMTSNVISTDQRLVEKVPFTKAIAESESIKPSSKNKELDG